MRVAARSDGQTGENLASRFTHDRSRRASRRRRSGHPLRPGGQRERQRRDQTHVGAEARRRRPGRCWRSDSRDRERAASALLESIKASVHTHTGAPELHSAAGRRSPIRARQVSGAILAEARALLKAELSPSRGVRALFEPLARLSLDYSCPVGDDDELHSVSRAEFHEDPRDVRLGGEWAEVKRAGRFRRWSGRWRSGRGLRVRES